MIKFQQSQALTSLFESFWSIVDEVYIQKTHFRFVQCYTPENIVESRIRSHSRNNGSVNVKKIRTKPAKVKVEKKGALCSRNFQNVKLRLDFVDI